MNARAWFVPMTPDGDLRLVTFPFAGGGCAQFAGLGRSAARHGMSVLAANLPGRQARLDEPARTGFAPLVRELADALVELLDHRPYLLLGTCSGSLLAFGVLRELVTRGVPLPERLVVVSYEAPDIAARPRRMLGLSSPSLWSNLAEWGGVPPDLVADERMHRVAEPAIRADLAVLASYRHEPGIPVPVPITVCFGERDTDLARGALLGWRRQTAVGMELCGFDGGHWLLEDACDELVESLVRHSTGPAYERIR